MLNINLKGGLMDGGDGVDRCQGGGARTQRRRDGREGGVVRRESGVQGTIATRVIYDKNVEIKEIVSVS